MSSAKPCRTPSLRPFSNRCSPAFAASLLPSPLHVPIIPLSSLSPPCPFHPAASVLFLLSLRPLLSQMNLRGIDIDMTFAQVPLHTVSDDFNIKDDAVLRGVDYNSMQSLNGPRTTELIRLLVPKYVLVLFSICPPFIWLSCTRVPLVSFPSAVFLPSPFFPPPQLRVLQVSPARGPFVGETPWDLLQQNGFPRRCQPQRHGRPHLPGVCTRVCARYKGSVPVCPSDLVVCSCLSMFPTCLVHPAVVAGW